MTKLDLTELLESAQRAHEKVRSLRPSEADVREAAACCDQLAYAFPHSQMMLLALSVARQANITVQLLNNNQLHPAAAAALVRKALSDLIEGLQRLNDQD